MSEGQGCTFQQNGPNIFLSERAMELCEVLLTEDIDDGIILGSGRKFRTYGRGPG